MKSKGISNFLFSFLLTLFMISFFSLMLSTAYFGREGYLQLFSARIFSFPFLFYILIFSISAGIVSSIRTIYSQKQKSGMIEEYLRYLANGEYTASLYRPLFEEEDSESSLTTSSSEEEIGPLILQIRRNLVELSKEVQGRFKQKEEGVTQSKEDILEEERHRIARELHDSVSQQLFAAAMMLSAIDQQSEVLPEMFQKQVKVVLQILNESQSEMRALLLHLRPVKLEGKTLKQGIEQLLNELKTKTNIKIIWQIEDLHPDPTIENHLFRIVQELLSNTLRHAKANLLEVYLSEKDQNVLLKVVDDGKGFDVTQSKTGSYGLKNIQERISAMGGTVRILSFPAEGTSVEIKVPVI